MTREIDLPIFLPLWPRNHMIHTYKHIPDKLAVSDDDDGDDSDGLRRLSETRYFFQTVA